MAWAVVIAAIIGIIAQMCKKKDKAAEANGAEAQATDEDTSGIWASIGSMVGGLGESVAGMVNDEDGNIDPAKLYGATLMTTSMISPKEGEKTVERVNGALSTTAKGLVGTVTSPITGAYEAITSTTWGKWLFWGAIAFLAWFLFFKDNDGEEEPVNA